jgi:hypothetical protein
MGSAPPLESTSTLDAILSFIGSRRFIALLFVLFFWGGGAALAVWNHRLSSMVQIEATVIDAWPLKRTSRGFGRDRTTSISYVPKVRFAYQLNGRRYEAEDAKWDLVLATPQATEDLIRRDYQKGSKLSVYVSPDNPTEALIYRDIPSAVFAIALVMGAISAGFLVKSWRAG